MQNKKLNIALRSATGLILTAAGVLLVTNLSQATLPPIERALPEISVSTESATGQTVVCPGSFAVLGANPESPDAAVPVGEPETLIKNVDALKEELTTQLSPPAPPFAATDASAKMLAAASAQTLGLESVKGTTAVTCAEALSDQWIAAGDTIRGTTSTLVLSNPGLVPATASIVVHDESGKVDAKAASGVLVPAQSQRIIPLSGFGPGRANTVIRVTSSGSPVVAMMGVTQIQDLVPTGADMVNSQPDPQSKLVFVGTTNFVDHSHATDAPTADEYPATVRLLAPDQSGQATITGHAASGEIVDLGTINFVAGTTIDTQIEHLPANVQAVVVTASAPVVGGLHTQVHAGNDHDFTWIAPSAHFTPEMLAATALDIVAPSKAKIIVVNLGAEDAKVTDRVKDEEFTIRAGATKIFAAGRTLSLTADQPLAAGGLIFDNRSISTYPALAPSESIGTLTLFPR